MNLRKVTSHSILTASIALAGLSAGVTLVPGIASTGRSVYEGGFVSDAQSQAILTVPSDPRRGERIRFRVKNLEIACDDGTTPRANIAPIRARLRNRTEFRGERYRIASPGQSFFQVKGRLLRGGRAAGRILYIDDNNDALPGAGPDCGTHRRRNWTAERVR
jgi:hypothetical protein